MPLEIPSLGDAEGLSVEFKRAEGLRDPKGRRVLVRSVVSMRNANGGVIWVGAHEQGDEFNGFDPLGDSDERWIRALQDHLVDSVEPALRVGEDVRLEKAPSPTGSGWILAIVVKPRPSKAPFACYRDGNSREFLRRSGSRTTLVPHAELFPRPTNSDAELAEKRALRLHEKWCSKFGDSPGFAFSFVPEETQAPAIDPPEEWRDLLERPDTWLVRPNGYTWHATRGGREQVTLRHHAFVSGDWTLGREVRALEVRAGPRIHFFTNLGWLVGDWEPIHRGQQAKPCRQWVSPYPILETVASLCRLAARLVHHSTVQDTDRYRAVAEWRNASGLGTFFGERHTSVGGPLDPDPEHARTGLPVRTASVLRTAADPKSADDTFAFDLLVDLFEPAIQPALEEFGQGNSFRALIPWFVDRREFKPPA